MSVGSPEVFLILSEIGELLGVDLDRDSLAFALRLINDRMEPVKLAELLRDWREKVTHRKQDQEEKPFTLPTARN